MAKHFPRNITDDYRAQRDYTPERCCYAQERSFYRRKMPMKLPPRAVRKKMRPVFHSSEIIQFERLELDPVGALPPREDEDNPTSCRKKKRSWSARYAAGQCDQRF